MIYIIGGGGHGKVVFDILRQSGIEEDAIQFLDDVVDSVEIHQKKFKTQPVHLERIEPIQDKVVVAIGDNYTRKMFYEKIVEQGLELLNAIHPSAIISPYSMLGSNLVLAANCVINPNSTIQDNVIVNTCASIDHDNWIGKHSQIAPGARLAGTVTIAEGCFIGTGAIINPGISIGKNSIIGSGSVVTKDIPANVLAYGVPAKIKKRTSNQ